MRKIKYLGTSLLLLSLVGFNGCGSGGGGDDELTTESNNKTYNLRSITFQNYSINAPVTISTSNDELEYILSVTTKPKIVVNNQNFTPITYIGSLDNKTNGASILIDRIEYYNDNGIEIQSINHENQNICNLVNNPTPLPTMAKIGDSGIGENTSCSDGTSSKNTWILMIKGDDAVFKRITNDYDINGDLESTDTSYYYIDADGKIKKVSLSAYIIESKATLTIPETNVIYR